jgi:hypothetical protein
MYEQHPTRIRPSFDGDTAREAEWKPAGGQAVRTNGPNPIRYIVVRTEPDDFGYDVLCSRAGEADRWIGSRHLTPDEG